MPSRKVAAWGTGPPAPNRLGSSTGKPMVAVPSGTKAPVGLMSKIVPKPSSMKGEAARIEPPPVARPGLRLELGLGRQRADQDLAGLRQREAFEPQRFAVR